MDEQMQALVSVMLQAIRISRWDASVGAVGILAAGYRHVPPGYVIVPGPDSDEWPTAGLSAMMEDS
jgi:hypothetical protein